MNIIRSAFWSQVRTLAYILYHNSLQLYVSENGERQARVLPCGHTFCFSCVRELHVVHGRGRLILCPCCRSSHEIGILSEVPRNFTVELAAQRVHSAELATRKAPASEPSRATTSVDAPRSFAEGHTGSGASSGGMLSSSDTSGVMDDALPLSRRRPAARRPPGTTLTSAWIRKYLSERVAQNGNKPLSLQSVINELTECELWPPSNIRELWALTSGPKCPMTGDVLKAPTPALLKCLLECTNAPTVDRLGKLVHTTGGVPTLHIERGKRSCAKYLCNGTARYCTAPKERGSASAVGMGSSACVAYTCTDASLAIAAGDTPVAWGFKGEADLRHDEGIEFDCGEGHSHHFTPDSETLAFPEWDR